MDRKIDKKVFRDPLYGYIVVEDRVIWDLINSKEFQRLKRIKQLGGVDSVFHTAEHSRFSHSLGVYHLATKVVSDTPDINEYLTEREKLLLYSSALLHDVGHGPFSHAFESFFGIDHEYYTIKIILGNTEVNEVLSSVDNNFAKDVAKVISKEYNNDVILELVSSQLDLDRLDYLGRDAYFTGAKYGQVDIDRIIRTMKVKDGMLVHKSTSIIAIEDYLMSRYNMYWQVYFHPVGRSFEIIVGGIYKRIRELYFNGVTFSAVYDPLLKFISDEEVSVEDYLRLDDHVIYNIILESEDHFDPILSDLAQRILHRRLFKDIELNSKTTELKANEIKEILVNKGMDLDYYFVKDSLNQILYDGKYDLDKAAHIKLLMPDGSIKELKNSSKIISSLIDIADKVDTRLYYPSDSL